MVRTPAFATPDDTLILYARLTSAEKRAVQRRIQSGELHRIRAGVASSRPAGEWSSLIARERNQVLAALFPGAVLGYRTAFAGGLPVEGVVHLSYRYDRKVELPGLTVVLVNAHGHAAGDQPIAGLDLYFPSTARMLMENLSINRGKPPKAVGRRAVEERLLTMCQARGEASLGALRSDARDLAPGLGLQREFTVLDELIGALLGSRPAAGLATDAGRARAMGLPYDRARLEKFDILAAALRSRPLPQPPDPVRSATGRSNFAFLESYFSNFIEGTEFDIQEARAIALEDKPVVTRPKDSHDIRGVFLQAVTPGWSNQTLAAGEPVLEQLRARHADQMRARPEAEPGQFKSQANFAGNTSFVDPALVRGTLVKGSDLLPSVPPGIARGVYAMFLVSEVHPFVDGNGRLARLVMNAELSVVASCRIIVPTLYREEYLDCLRVMTRLSNPLPYLDAMARIHRWTAAFDYEDLDAAIATMQACHAFEKSRVQFKLGFPATPA